MTCSPELMSKSSQLMMALSEVWLIFNWVALGLVMFAVPEVTIPVWGRAKLGVAATVAATIPNTAVVRRRLER